jgi:hypothetical protein
MIGHATCAFRAHTGEPTQSLLERFEDGDIVHEKIRKDRIYRIRTGFTGLKNKIEND